MALPADVFILTAPSPARASASISGLPKGGTAVAIVCQRPVHAAVDERRAACRVCGWRGLVIVAVINVVTVTRRRTAIGDKSLTRPSSGNAPITASLRHTHTHCQTSRQNDGAGHADEGCSTANGQERQTDDDDGQMVAQTPHRSLGKRRKKQPPVAGIRGERSDVIDDNLMCRCLRDQKIGG